MRLNYENLEKIRNFTYEDIYNSILDSLFCKYYTSSSNYMSAIYLEIGSNLLWLYDFMPYRSKLRQYFNKQKKYINLQNPERNWNLEKEYIKNNKDKVDKDMIEFTEEFKKEVSLKKEEILKLIEKRKKQIFRTKKVTEKNKSIKQNLMEEMEKVLIELGYQVSKVVNRNYYDISVSKRKIADKYHKYIETEKNVKFATVEVKINTKSYSIGIKIATNGQIGCLYEDFIKMQEKITKEYNILVGSLERKV